MSRFKHIAVLVMLLGFSQVAWAQTLNDGGIRLRIWLHKMWSNANCIEDDINFLANETDHVWKDIQVRVPNANGGFDPSANGLSMYFEGYGSNKWMRVDEATGVFLGGLADIFFPMEDPATKGRKIYDRTYNLKNVPKNFQWRLGQYYEKDGCLFGIGSDLIWFVYEEQNLFSFNPLEICLDGDDNLVSNTTWQQTPVDFRSTAPGEVGYMQTGYNQSSGLFNNTDNVAIVFAYQWDYVRNFPNTCFDEEVNPEQVYKDGPITVEARITRLYSDSDFDASFYCGPSFGSEELRMKYRARDNLTATWSPWVTAPERSQGSPGWAGYGTPLTQNLTWNYGVNDAGFSGFELDFQVHEEDGCGPSGDYNTGCINDDDIFYAATRSVNWRNSPPNTWNGLDLPLRLSGSRNQSWSVGIEVCRTAVTKC